MIEYPDVKLREFDVHVWRVFLPILESRKDGLEKFLSEEQIERGQRIIRYPERNYHPIKAGMLRALIGKYVDVNPVNVNFVISQYGKPALAPGLTEQKLEFNVSHSGDWFFLALALRNPVGIDVEATKRDFPLVHVSGRFFSVREASVVKLMPESSRPTTFFRIWVRKEAYIKAVGKGLSLSLKSFEAPGLSSIRDHDDVTQTCKFVGTLDNQWNFYDVPAASGYSACFVTDFHPTRIHMLDINSAEKFESLRLIT